MPLAAIVSSLDDVPDALRDYYKEGRDELADRYVLDVGTTDGYGLANVEKLRKGLDKERGTAKDQRRALKDAEDKIAALTTELEELQEGAGDVAEARKKWEADTQKRLDSARSEHQRAVEEITKQRDSYRTQLVDGRVTEAITKALTRAGKPQAPARIMGPMLRQHLRPIEDDDGTVRIAVIDEHGDARAKYVGGQQSAMTVDDLVDEMATDPELSDYFVVPNAKGGPGRQPGQQSPGSMPRQNVRISRAEASDHQAWQRATKEAKERGFTAPEVLDE